MIFLGTTFCSGKYTLYPPLSKRSIITAIQIFDGTYNHIYMTTDINCKSPDEGWTWDTLLNATFNKGLGAGNSDFGLENTDHIVIKRREVGTNDWITIFVQDVSKADDFDIHIKDTFARSGTEYEYSISSYLNGMENSYVISNVYSDFDGFYITDKDCLYGTIYDVDGCDTSRNIVSQTLELLNSKYMTVVSNSNTNCDKGSIKGTFLKENEYGVYDRKRSLEYRNDFKNRLANRKPLILKIDDGRIWMIRVTGTPTDSMRNHKDVRDISFEWIEIGDVNDMKTLYMNGFSDVDSRWW